MARAHSRLSRQFVRRLPSLWSGCEGAVLVEFTIVITFLFVLGLGVFEFGKVLYQHHLIATGLRDAARYLARLDDPVGSAAAGKEIAVYGEIAGTTPRVSWWTTGEISVSVATVANPIDGTTGLRTYRGPDPIQIVRVSTTATYPGLGFLGFLGLGSGLTIKAFHEERGVGE